MKSEVHRAAPRSSPRVIVALGSNLGDPRRNVAAALERLRTFSSQEFTCSSLWQTQPVDCPPNSPPFVNAVAAFRPLPTETPESLLTKLQALEKEFGRQPKQVLNEPRPLDLDLIAFGSQTRCTRAFTLPHPRARERRFVLQPLSEIAPDFVLPGQDKTVQQLLDLLPPEPGMKRLT